MMIEHICAEPDIYRIEVPLPNNPLRYLNSFPEQILQNAIHER